MNILKKYPFKLHVLFHYSNVSFEAIMKYTLDVVKAIYFK